MGISPGVLGPLAEKSSLPVSELASCFIAAVSILWGCCMVPETRSYHALPEADEPSKGAKQITPQLMGKDTPCTKADGEDADDQEDQTAHLVGLNIPHHDTTEDVARQQADADA